MYKTKLRAGVLLTLTGLLLASPASPIFTTNNVQAQEEVTETEEKKPRKKPRGRVPNHYGKLGLSPKQKETIYGIQAKYDQQIDALEKQIEELEAEEDQEIEDVLTDVQRARLQEILKEVEARRKKSSN